MNGSQFALAAYAVVIVICFGYGLLLWAQVRTAWRGDQKNKANGARS